MKAKASVRQSDGGGRSVVLVGTYRPECSAWIRGRRLYNLPLPETGAGTFHRSVARVVLIAEGERTLAHAAKFEREADGSELAQLGYPVAAKGKAHGERYALYSLGEKLSATQALHGADVYVASTRCPQVKIDAAFYRRPYPKVGGRSMPHVFDTLKPHFAKWRTATTFDPKVTQGEFLDILDEVDKKMRKFKKPKTSQNILRFVDLFAGIGGIRKGFELACSDRGYEAQCVFTSEIKPHALDVLRQNHPDEYIHGDITKVDETKIPDFDILLGGFPCQAFSAAGKRLGFEDTRGTLFFDVARIIKAKRPFGFVLENVEGLVNHDKRNAKSPIGHTLEVILDTLDELGYKVAWRVLNASNFGIPQDRKRIYIVGTQKAKPNLTHFDVRHSSVASVLESGLPTQKSRFIDKLLSHYKLEDLLGKSIKDKRGGKDNIHSWDFEWKGHVSEKQKTLLNLLLKERRKHQWAEQYGIDWMDGMPLTIEMIRTFFNDKKLEEMLEDLVVKRYVVKEHPKRKVKEGKVFVRVQDKNLPLGYNIVAGKMSFEINKILSPAKIAPTLVAMDMQHLFVVDGQGIRNLSLREGLRLFGYPEDFRFNVQKDLGYDLLGNTVVVPVIKAVAGRILDVYNPIGEIHE